MYGWLSLAGLRLQAILDLRDRGVVRQSADSIGFSIAATSARIAQRRLAARRERVSPTFAHRSFAFLRLAVIQTSAKRTAPRSPAPTNSHGKWRPRNPSLWASRPDANAVPRRQPFGEGH
ncbi:unnamed protein product [Heligmosomoides polygyrus]|uniref:HTH_Tnp_ISL3 domain-containing protein n=1 Tax=Heligmosomoides polygyrus TaxID=6339 RepID=A0A183G7G8_HELPZ|nr:unnamed protein product [Heligmosomoides polygyrus]